MLSACHNKIDKEKSDIENHVMKTKTPLKHRIFFFKKNIMVSQTLSDKFKVC